MDVPETAERVIWNLVHIQGLEETTANLCKVALQDWQSNAEFYGKRVDKKQKEVRNLRNEIYQVVGFYSAFEGLLLTAVAQSSLLHCNNQGFPLALSALATIVALVGIGQKNLNIREWKRLIEFEDPTRKAYGDWVLKLQKCGISFDFKETSLKGTLKCEENWYAGLYSFLFSYEGQLESFQLFKYKMARISTKIFNRTGANVRVKEGNGHLMHIYFDIPPKQVKGVFIEPNATYRRFSIAPSDLEINSAYCTDNKVVYLRMDNAQNLFLDPVLRTSTMVSKTIVNKTSQIVVVKEVIEAKEGNHGIVSTELEQLAPKNKFVFEVETDPTGGHRKYFLEVVSYQAELEITDDLKNGTKSKMEVTFGTSGNLCFGPAQTFPW